MKKWKFDIKSLDSLEHSLGIELCSNGKNPLEFKGDVCSSNYPLCFERYSHSGLRMVPL